MQMSVPCSTGTRDFIDPIRALHFLLQHSVLPDDIRDDGANVTTVSRKKNEAETHPSIIVWDCSQDVGHVAPVR